MEFPQFYQVGEVQFYALMAAHRHIAVHMLRPSIAHVKYDPSKENSPIYDEVMDGRLHYKPATKDEFLIALKFAQSRIHNFVEQL